METFWQSINISGKHQSAHPPHSTLWLIGFLNLILLSFASYAWKNLQINMADIIKFTTTHSDICPTFTRKLI